MTDKLEFNFESLRLLEMGGAVICIVQALTAGQALRLGQSAVLSTKVHAFDAHNPEHVQILINTDAGQVFYHRTDCGAVCHLDVFHECGEVDHRLAANYICRAVAFYNTYAVRQAGESHQGVVNPALIDVQTATGGGRITGSLQGGQKLSVRRVHENHVHVALSMSTADFICLIYIAAAVETAVQAVGLELRCNERITYVESADEQHDLSPYTDQTDSLLSANPEVAEGRKSDSPVDNHFQELAQAHDRKSEGAAVNTGNGNIRGSGQTLVGVKEYHSEFKLSGNRQHETASPVAVPGSSFYTPRLYESWKQAIAQGQSRNNVAAARQSSRYVQESGLKVAGASHKLLSEMDVAATVSAAAARLVAEGRTGRLRIQPLDIRFVAQRPRHGSDICLVVDCSGSMAGLRLKAAKYLAGEVCRYGCSRISLVQFQDNSSELIQPFTYNRQAVLSIFDTFTPAGATPLALGLRRSLTYITGQQTRSPLLVLITDGIPSRKYTENVNPLSEALLAATAIKQANCGLLCIGLDADEGFLKTLADTAGGVAYIFTEFATQSLRL